VREEMVKHFAKEMVQESGQEVIQKSMEVTVNNVFDRLLSYDIRLQKDITL
jgi:hypothetical protein